MQNRYFDGVIMPLFCPGNDGCHKKIEDCPFECGNFLESRGCFLPHHLETTLFEYKGEGKKENE